MNNPANATSRSSCHDHRTSANDGLQGESLGRKIYIHERSLFYLATKSSRHAEFIFSMLGKIIIIKIMHHVLEQDAVALGQISPQRAGSISAAVIDTWGINTTQCLRRIALRENGEEFTLIRQDEVVVATCYFAGYFTFATSNSAAAEMFADETQIAEIKNLQKKKSGYNNLKLITGNRLLILGEAIGKLQGCSAREMELVQRNVTDELLSDFGKLVERCIPNSSPDEESIIEKMNSLCRQAMSRGLFKRPNG